MEIMNYDAIAEYKSAMDRLEVLKSIIIDTLKTAINDCKALDGVKSVGNSKLCFTVPLSTLMKEGSWSAEYYSNEKQIKEVENYLFAEPKGGILTLETVQNRLNTLAETGYIKRGSNRFALNSNMKSLITELRDSLI